MMFFFSPMEVVTLRIRCYGPKRIRVFSPTILLWGMGFFDHQTYEFWGKGMDP